MQSAYYFEKGDYYVLLSRLQKKTLQWTKTERKKKSYKNAIQYYVQHINTE